MDQRALARALAERDGGQAFDVGQDHGGPDRRLATLRLHRRQRIHTDLEATQGQINGFCSQRQCKCPQNRVASVGD